jgi:hypothetical protein
MMTPTQVNNLLWQRGLPDVGEWLQRELQHVDYLKDRVDQLKLQVLELEQLLPDDVKEDRKRQQRRACSCLACELRRRPQSTTGVRRLTTARCRGPGGQLERAISRCFTRAARDFTRQLLAKRCIADAADAEPDDATYHRQLGRRFP